MCTLVSLFFLSLLNYGIGCENFNNSKNGLLLDQADTNNKWQRTFFVLQVVATIITILAAIFSTFFAIYDHIFADKQTDNSIFIVNIPTIPDNDNLNVLSLFQSIIENINPNIDSLQKQIDNYVINNRDCEILINIIGLFVLNIIRYMGILKRSNKKNVFTHLSLC